VDARDRRTIPRGGRNLSRYGLASTVIGLVAAVRVGIVTLKIARAHKAFQWRVRIWRKPTCEH
jgi:hypothetical protein